MDGLPGLPGLIGMKGELAYSSPVIADGVCVQFGGFGGPSIGFKLGGTGNITEKNRLWRTPKNPQSIGSGVFVNGHVFIPDAATGSLRCIDPKTGKETWRERTGGQAGPRAVVDRTAGRRAAFA